MKKKQSNKNFIIVAAIITVFAVAILVAISILKGGKTTQNKAEAKYNEVSDLISRLVESADKEIRYINSTKREVLILIGSENYYGIYQNEGKLYIKEGTYSGNSTSEDARKTEADNAINATGGYSVLADNVTYFHVASAYDKDGHFTEDKVTIEIKLGDADGNVKSGTFAAKIPVKEETPAE